MSKPPSILDCILNGIDMLFREGFDEEAKAVQESLKANKVFGYLLTKIDKELSAQIEVNKAQQKRIESLEFELAKAKETTKLQKLIEESDLYE